MPNFRCEYSVTGDLVLPSELSQHQYTNCDGVEITFSNGEVNDEGHAIKLLATVIGPSESIDTAEKDLESVLVTQLDLLTFATHSRFKLIEPIRLIEWEAGQKKRNLKAFNTVDARYPPDPELEKKYIDTIIKLEQARPPAFTLTALKYFRYGLLDDSPEDQFMRLWLALEIIAENIKQTDPVKIICPVCESSLKCGECGTEPTRVPMAKNAIEELINKIAGKAAKDVSKRQFITRNGLMHGRKRDSIEKECKVSISDIVNELGFLAWNAIFSTIPTKDKQTFEFGHRHGDFTNMKLVMSVLGSFDHSGDESHPAEDKIPKVEVSLITNFKSPEEKA
jgi:hypothetical protein